MPESIPCAEDHDLAELQAAVGNALLPDSSADRIAEIFSALADPTRVKIIGLLAEQELCVGDLCALLAMSQPAVSHHLRVMRNLRIVASRKAGRHAYYNLADQHILDLFQVSSQHVSHE